MQQLLKTEDYNKFIDEENDKFINYLNNNDYKKCIETLVSIADKFSFSLKNRNMYFLDKKYNDKEDFIINLLSNDYLKKLISKENDSENIIKNIVLYLFFHNIVLKKNNLIDLGNTNFFSVLNKISSDIDVKFFRVEHLIPFAINVKYLDNKDLNNLMESYFTNKNKYNSLIFINNFVKHLSPAQFTEAQYFLAKNMNNLPNFYKKNNIDIDNFIYYLNNIVNINNIYFLGVEEIVYTIFSDKKLLKQIKEEYLDDLFSVYIKKIVTDDFIKKEDLFNIFTYAKLDKHKDMIIKLLKKEVSYTDLISCNVSNIVLDEWFNFVSSNFDKSFNKNFLKFFGYLNNYYDQNKINNTKIVIDEKMNKNNYFSSFFSKLLNKKVNDNFKEINEIDYVNYSLFLKLSNNINIDKTLQKDIGEIIKKIDSDVFIIDNLSNKYDLVLDIDEKQIKDNLQNIISDYIHSYFDLFNISKNSIKILELKSKVISISECLEDIKTKVNKDIELKIACNDQIIKQKRRF